MVSRAELELPSLSPLNVELDGRCSLDRLYFLVKFGKLINFYDENNKVQGSWFELLLKDPAISSAYICKTPYAQGVKEYIDLSSKLDELIAISLNNPLNLEGLKSKIIHVYTQLFGLIERVFLNIFEWYKIINSQLKEYSFKSNFLAEISCHIKKYLKQFIKLYESFCLLSKVDCSVNLSELSFISEEWTGLTSEAANSRVDTIAPSIGWSIKEGGEVLSVIHQKIFGLYLKFIKSAQISYRDLTSNSNSYPDTALIISFVRMLDDYKDQLNKNVGRHLDLYYERVLTLNNRNEIQDKTYICLEIEKDLNELVVKKDTKFNGGSYLNKKPIIFSSDNECCINGVSIAEAITVCYHNRESNKGLLTKKSVSSNLLTSKGKDVSASGIEMFGSKHDSRVDSGFMLSSPLFLLGTGNRKITITFNIESTSNPFLGSQVFLTNISGWLKAVNVLWSVDDNSPSRHSLTIHLTSDDPSIELSKDLKKGGKFSWPLIKILLSDFKELSVVKSIDVLVDVKNANARYSNDYGLVKSNGMSSPFGPAPKVNSHFYVDLPELYPKPITSLEVVFSWNNLPESFDEYYEAYNDFLVDPQSTFSNDCFKVMPNVLIAGKWQGVFSKTEDEFKVSQGSESMYQSSDGDQKIKNISKFSTFSLTPSSDKPIVFQSNINSYIGLLEFDSKPGLIRITLDSPSMGFGHDIYADVVSSVTVSNVNSFHKKETIKAQATSKSSAAVIKKLPSLPFTPTTNSIELNYSAECNIDFSQVNRDMQFQFYHCGVFSEYKVFDTLAAPNTINYRLLENKQDGAERNGQGINLFPVIDFNGALFLKLVNVAPPCSVSLLFEMSNWGGSSECDVLSSYKFHYMSKNGWKSLRVLSDETNHFSGNGIVVVYLPKDLSDEIEVFPGKGFWLAISNYSQNSSIGRLKSIHTQALQVTRVPPSYSLSDEKLQIKKGSISSSVVKIPGVKKIYQPFGSAGGHKRENKEEFRKRVSQRIKTKDRAITAGDFEQLSFQVSPKLHYSRCVKSDSLKSNINVVVVDSVGEGCLDSFTPSLVSSQRLDEIREYLVSRSSPFNRISVFNMRHQPVKISAKILFVNDAGTLEQCNSISNRIKEFMSPWCSTYKNTMPISEGLNRTDLLNLIIEQPDVLEVAELTIELSEGAGDNIRFVKDTRQILYPLDDKTIFVSANNHEVYM